MAIPVVVVVAGVPEGIRVAVDLIRVEHQRAVVPRVLDAVVVRVRVAGVAEAVPVRVCLGRVGGLRTVVRTIGDPVSVHVGLARVAEAVPVQVLLAGIALQGAVVRRVRDAVVVVVVVAGVADPVLVREVGLVRVGQRGAEVRDVEHPVAVRVGIADVPDLVAVQVLLSGVGFEGAVVEGVLDSVTVVVRGEAVRDAVTVRVGVALVGLAVAVIVPTVADLERAGMDPHRERRAVVGVRDAVVVVVVVAGVAPAVEIVVRLVEVRQQGTEVVPVRDPVPVIVGVHAVRLGITVRVRKALVRGPVQVVVQAVADLRGRDLRGQADGLAVDAHELPLDDPVLVLDLAALRRDVIHRAVAVVVHQVAGLLGRVRRVAIAQATGDAAPDPLAGAPLVLARAGGPGPPGGVPVRAATLPRGRDALPRSGPPFPGHAGVALRAAAGVVTAPAAEGARGRRPRGHAEVVLAPEDVLAIRVGRAGTAEPGHQGDAQVLAALHGAEQLAGPPVRALGETGLGADRPRRGLETDPLHAVPVLFARAPEVGLLRVARRVLIGPSAPGVRTGRSVLVAVLRRRRVAPTDDQLVAPGHLDNVHVRARILPLGVAVGGARGDEAREGQHQQDLQRDRLHGVTPPRALRPRRPGARSRSRP